MKPVKALIVTGFGINCEEEMAAAYKMAGAEAEVVHLNDILIKGLSIQDYDIFNFPGGFSFGDDISSGKVLANKIKYKELPNGGTLLDELRLFIASGKYVMGICNGFQVLVKLGLLPNISGEVEQEASLRKNDSAIFENRWCYVKVNDKSKTPFLRGLDVFPLPVRHGEGKLIIGNESVKQGILDQSLNCLSYCTASGELTSDYPLNPNGADLDCAGLCDPTGQVFGLMPHPEAYLTLYNHPNWGQMKRRNPDLPDEGEGLNLFRNIVEHISKQKELVAVNATEN